jgi:hypothetical protein
LYNKWIVFLTQRRSVLLARVLVHPNQRDAPYDYDWLRLTDGVRIMLAGEGGVKLIVFLRDIKNNRKQLINDLKNIEITQHFGFA